MRPLWVSIVIRRAADLVKNQAAIRFPSGDQVGEVMCSDRNRAPMMPLFASGTGVPPPTCTAIRRTFDHVDVVRLSVAALKTSSVPSGENVTGSSETFFATGSSCRAPPRTFTNAILSVS